MSVSKSTRILSGGHFNVRGKYTNELSTAVTASLYPINILYGLALTPSVMPKP